ncbi:RelA/SpoT [Moelleriella libera RCEF 2490]|uniref:RelA/SpoT n=1 Tax=Moelleriella libera RCEF 2490 TaxID=1081109 RepID=A0A167YCI9_9HYPO|nr:RelA/SpoT [Moelleriella libera RCEF 2490]
MVSLIEQFVQRYEPNVGFHAQVASLVAARCRSALERHKMPALVTWRAKRPDRLAEKLKKRNKYRNYATEADMHIDAMDLSGVRIALYYPFQEEEVMLLLEELFLVRDVKIHGDIAAATLMMLPTSSSSSSSSTTQREGLKKIMFENRASGYRAIHAHVELGPEHLAGEDDDRSNRAAAAAAAAALVEIQITSLAMHVWSEVEHDLVYKARYGTATLDELQILHGVHGSIRSAEALLHQLRTSMATRFQVDTKAKL